MGAEASMSQSKNPYRPAGPLHEGDLFVDREREIDQIVQAFKRNQSVSIFGKRRIGKTSLLFHLKENLKKQMPNARVEYFTFELIPSAEEFFNRLAKLLRIKTWETYVDFETVLQGKPIILMLDEFDRALYREDKFPPDFFSVLRGWDVQDWLHLLVSTQKPLSESAGVGSVTSPFGNTFLVLELGNLEKGDGLKLLNPLDRLTKHWDTNWKGQALAETECHPWRTQLFGYHAFDMLAREPKTTFKNVQAEYRKALSDQITTPLNTAAMNEKNSLRRRSTDTPSQTAGRKRPVPFVLIAALVGLGSLSALIGGLTEIPFILWAGFALMVSAFVLSLFRMSN
jgi:hypothetical protein